MKKYLLLLILVLVLTLAYYLAAKKDGFAIYLLARDIPAREIARTDIAQFVLETKPILSGD